jgi:hypothetical protein
MYRGGFRNAHWTRGGRFEVQKIVVLRLGWVNVRSGTLKAGVENDIGNKLQPRCRLIRHPGSSPVRLSENVGSGCQENEDDMSDGCWLKWGHQEQKHGNEVTEPECLLRGSQRRGLIEASAF